MSSLLKVTNGMGFSPKWNVSMVVITFKISSGCTALDMPERREMTEKIY